MFSQTLYYDESYGGSAKQYNGNISAMSWKTLNEGTTLLGYAFTYDNLSRLTKATYLGNGTVYTNGYETSYTYDKMGNMKTLARSGLKATSSWGPVDNLTTYTGNQLTRTEDALADISVAGSMDFKNYSNVATEYTYNKNGAMTQDLNKGISAITYNSLNLPRLMDVKSPVAEARNEYTYTATGTKLKVVKKWNPNYSTTPVVGSTVNTALMTVSETTDYIGNKIYENGTLKRILIDNGYIEENIYYFYIKDHLGNNRIVAKSNGTLVQATHYYPFGSSFAVATGANVQLYKYNNKELDTMHGLNWYDYSARYKDDWRFTTMDPHSEKYYSWSPYVYCFNNPLKFIDPDGRKVKPAGTAELVMIQNTLPKESRQYVRLDKDGYIDQQHLNSYDGNSGNYNDLKGIVNSKLTMEVVLDDKFQFMESDGKLGVAKMSYGESDPDFARKIGEESTSLSTGETGFQGKTLFPDKNGIQNSPNENLKVIVNKNLSDRGRAETFSHEGYAHGYIYISTNRDRQKASHQYAPGNRELNHNLFDKIVKALDETIKNMQK